MRSPSGPTSTTQVPVGSSGSKASRASTPLALSSSRALRPRSSSPTRPTSTVSAPAAASHAAVLAAEPPPWKRIVAGASLPGANGPDSRTTTSTITSPEHDHPAHRRQLGRRAAPPGAALREHEAHVRLEARAPRLARQVVEQERRHVLAGHALALGGRQALGEHALVERRVELLVLGQRVRHDDGPPVGAHLAPRGHHRGDLLRGVHPPRHRVAGVREVEAREAVRAVAEDRHVERLEALERRAHVEDRLDARRTRRRSPCGPAPPGPRTRPSSRARRGGLRRARRWRTSGCPPRAARCAVAATVVPP